jgi:hypothetical protein
MKALSHLKFALVAAATLVAGTLGFSATVSAQTVICENTCPHANDGECDDGGTNSLYSLCPLGSDCADCGPRTVLCTDTCPHAHDGECDDGGPDSLYSICDLGSDCGDCGPREVVGGAPAAPTAGGPTICTNTCPHADDGECDDGGPNSLYSICAYGTDCNDCGPRPPIPGCSNTCPHANDGECDDGGPNSLYSICELGTDCADCGPR